MTIKDKVRNLLGIRTKRSPVRASAQMPKVGSSIVFEQFRICLKHPIDAAQWAWFLKKGWRAIDMRTNRRRYTLVPDKLLVELLDASEVDREALHLQLIKAPDVAVPSEK